MAITAITALIFRKLATAQGQYVQISCNKIRNSGHEVLKVLLTINVCP